MDMNPQLPSGVYPTMITPFDHDRRVDFEAAEKLVHWYIENGCQGIFAVCQSSEIFQLELEEEVELVRRVVRITKEHLRPDGTKMAVVASGHTALTRETQAKELRAIYEAGADAMVLITNRMDPGRHTDADWIADTEKLLALLPESMPLGLYECPSPYKRLLSREMLHWCVESGRFQFIKDTCCDETILKARLEQLAGTGIQLYNANAQTLLPSLKAGAAGYCGVMANFYPKAYVWLYEHYRDQPELAEKVAAMLSLSAFTESLPYPVTAKYYLSELVGIPMNTTARVRPDSDLKDYDKLVLRQLKLLFDEMDRMLFS